MGTNRKEQVNSPLELMSLLNNTAPNRVFIAILFGCLAGICYALVIPIILLSLQQTESRFLAAEEEVNYWLFGVFEVSTPKLALFFFSVCVGIMIFRTVSRTLLARVTIDASTQLRKRIYQHVLSLPIQELERLGPSRLVTAVNKDVSEVTNGAAVLPGLAANFSTLIGLLLYLIYLDFNIFVFVVAAILFGAVTYRLPLIFGQRLLVRARNKFDELQEGVRSLIYGAKELKLNQNRKTSFLSEGLHSVEKSYSSAQKNGLTMIIFGETYGDLISFFAIGGVAFILANYYALSQQNLLGVVIVLIYIMGPIAVFMSSINPLMRAKIATRKLQSLLNDMPVEKQFNITSVEECQQIQLEALQYSYINVHDMSEVFEVGPINLELKRGEVVFLTGGNGSGKTTLGKLISLLYLPNKGTIKFNNEVVTEENRDSLRQNISSIFSDFYLFKKLYGFSGSWMDAVTLAHIKELGLEGKVDVKDNVFSNTCLSDGQRKRLALIVSYLEDRSICIFDEWAADQDPGYKEFFYMEILPKLKRMNKFVIVISHDDRYFDSADKIIKMENGLITEIRSNNHQAISAGDTLTESKCVAAG
uniref:PvdE, pyoverdine ABC export system, fused ATPase and permease components n=1 Tax=Rheinheimera sp. BAL341 TaxID=1708203 RepID=A0A486XPU0_9GAMM